MNAAKRFIPVSLLISLLTLSCMTTPKKDDYKLQKITLEGFIPYEEGYEKGTSGAYGGFLGDYLITGAGCNFPDKPNVDGGKKKYYGAFYAVKGGEAKLFARMPSPRGYGASVINKEGDKLFLVGGTDDSTLYPAIFEVRLEDGEPVMERIEHALPFGWAEGGAALRGHMLYLAGGWEAKGKPLTDVVSFDLLTGKSERLATLPGSEGRIQPGVFVKNGKLYLYGGNNPSDGTRPSSVHDKSFALDLETREWREVAQPETPTGKGLLPFVGTAVTKAPGTGEIYAAGGVNREVFNAAVLREYNQSKAPEKEMPRYAELRREYLTQEPAWYRFSPTLWRFNPETETWEVLLTDPAFATAGALLTGDTEGRLFLVGGERKPGIRTPDIFEVRK